ncbi:tetratricopeptide repeat-containing glycosyltransferase family 2 protein [Paenibacillus crassostreae]|uniref:Glycosyl transferase n=1 Tax=Paenibacillus crassostreae TaxID=1763538 RepID=A0A167GMF9_9BACL|nr:glycosyltransferase [Paenibacillus crassostreae]AOZ92251.1 glycosyl transferase [Paenibacillus crassostreae]OAB77714.1 glycosyl transferase [Paenibacillus crassostreae]
MVTISLCMIVRDEEATIERCLKSVVGIVDEINIIDTGSVDRTKEIVGKYTDRIFDYEWIDNFGDARNYSFSKATKDFVLWLDADDVIEEADRKRFSKLKQKLTNQYDRVTMPYLLSFDTNGKPSSSLRRNRLVRRACGFQWIGPVHEYLSVFGPSLDSDVCITHRKEKTYTDRNLQIYQQRLDVGEEFSTRDLYYYANELKDHQMYDKAVIFYDKMLRTKEGWIEDNIQACLKMANCYSMLGNKDEQFISLARVLCYEKPRAEVSCEFGNYFFAEKQYDTAIYWYVQATQIENVARLGITNSSSSTWYPHLQLCLCYDRLKQYDKAYEHNEKAAAFHPTHPSMIYNRKYFRDTHKIGDPS